MKSEIVLSGMAAEIEKYRDLNSVLQIESMDLVGLEWEHDGRKCKLIWDVSGSNSRGIP